MSLDQAIAYFRAEQEDLFRSTATIKVKSGTTFDPVTGSNTPTYTIRATGVPCLIRPRSASRGEVAETEATISRHEGKFPANTNIQVEDLVDVTASTHDSGLVGKTFAVVERPLDDWQIARVVVLEVVEG